MDTSDPKITFDADGVCNHCRGYDKIAKEELLPPDKAKKKLDEIVSEIRLTGKNNKYDCIIGLSGGVDSTYLALLVKKLGLRPLAVHFDNGWNSELAVKNIENIVNKLGIDLFTYVINWEEFKDLQLAYLKASVIDVEVPTDHLIFAVLYKLAKKNNVKFLLPGSNIVTEAVLPDAWIYKGKLDLVNLESIHKQFGTIRLKKFPKLGNIQRLYYINYYGLRSIPILNYVPYNKKEIKQTIITELDWKDYGGKHYESIFTRFYQGYILPVKFGVDKRKAHLSNLICSKQITREEAMLELKKDGYDPLQLKIDSEFVLKKFDLTQTEFDAIMQLPVKQHSDYPTEKSIYENYTFIKPLKPIGDLLKKMFFS